VDKKPKPIHGYPGKREKGKKTLVWAGKTKGKKKGQFKFTQGFKVKEDFFGAKISGGNHFPKSV